LAAIRAPQGTAASSAPSDTRQPSDQLLEFLNWGQQRHVGLKRQQASADNIAQPSRQATITADPFDLLALVGGDQP
jgi:hypothetical protein